MKMNIGKILAIVLAFTMVFAMIPAIHADAAEPQTWTDDFSSGKGDHYTPHGWWWNMDGVLTVGDERAMAGVCYYWLNDMVWDDFVMEFDVINQTSEFGVILRAQAPGGVDCQNQGYGILYDTNWAFFMAENGNFTTFDGLVAAGTASAVEGIPTAAQPGTQNAHWKIVAKANRIEVYFNGATTPSMAMDATLWTSGSIGFRTNNPGGAVTAVIDNLTITEIIETTPEDTTPDDTTPEDTTPEDTTPDDTTPEDDKPAPAPGQTWTDDFSSDKGGSYIPHGYWWNMDGVLTVGDPNAGAGVCYYWLKDMVWDDFVMEFDVVNQTSEFGVILRAQDNGPHDCQNQGYGILYDTNWAFFMAENGKFSNFDALKDAGLANSVENYAWACQPGSTQNVHWKIVIKGERIEVYFNHSETPNMVMESSLYESGFIGFRTNNPGGTVTAVVDNLTITSLNNPNTGDSIGASILAAFGISTAALVVLAINKRRFVK